MTKRQKRKNLKNKLKIKGRTGKGTSIWSMNILLRAENSKRTVFDVQKLSNTWRSLECSLLAAVN